MSYRISILEFSRHNEIVWSFLKIILTEESQVDVFANEFVYNQLYDLHHDHRIRWYIKPEAQSSSEFIEQHRSHLLTRDRLLFTSVPPKDLKMFTDLDLAKISSLLIYDLHYYASEFHDINEGGNVLEVIKGQLTAQRKYIKTAFKHVDQILVPSKQILNYAKQNGMNSIDGFLDVLVLDKLKQRKVKKKIKIVVPGTVSYKRKNYEPIFEALGALNKVSTRQKIKVTFLGLSDERQAGKKLEELANEMNDHMEIEHFPFFVPQQNFDKIMRKANFLLLPIAERKESGAVYESYGYSTVSGCISDMVKFGKPALLPAFYPLEEALEPMVQRYVGGTDLASQLTDWIHHTSFEQLAMDGFLSFTPESQAASFFERLKTSHRKKHVA